MVIGVQIKKARLNAGFTQEQAAEALGVSRQTISNWENEKTLPDIISVVKMSDLYNISLDLLLKGGEPMSDYLNYLQDCTDVVKSKNNLSKLILILVSFVIWAFSLMVFWFIMDSGDALGYSVVFIMGLIPINIFVFSLITGINDFWGKCKWLSVPVWGILYMLLEYATFSAKNMIAFEKVNMPYPELFAAGAAVSLFGLILGKGIRVLKRKLLLKRDIGGSEQES
ncbi:MAG TPA: transcriptional regulator [Ruminococcaceae bacterium]|nr:transcriptional regulator [Oscillospiraceae bacterium]